jgi:hypothetical protein
VSPLILSLGVMNLQQSIFKCTMKVNVVVAMEPPFHVNPFIQLWQNFIPFSSTKKLFSIVFQVGGNCYNSSIKECWGWTHIFNPFISISKLWNRLCEHLPTVVGMFCQPFFTLKSFPYDATFEEWKEAKVCQLEA